MGTRYASSTACGFCRMLATAVRTPPRLPPVLEVGRARRRPLVTVVRSLPGRSTARQARQPAPTPQPGCCQTGPQCRECEKGAAVARQ